MTCCGLNIASIALLFWQFDRFLRFSCMAFYCKQKSADSIKPIESLALHNLHAASSDCNYSSFAQSVRDF